MPTDQESVPSVIWPAESGKYKVMQFYKNDEPYMRFSNDAFGKPACKHQKILIDFAKEIRIDTKRLVYDDGLFLLPDNVPYKMCGCDLCDISIKEKKSLFYGVGTDFQIGIDKKHIDKMKDKYPDWVFEY
ncbi:hypothetical protein HYZ41_02115 [archaeon]|nr:hypothetical protein [archaeon]